ncbi:MAG: aquaporin, partial [Gemmatimonadales bacterium]
ASAIVAEKFPTANYGLLGIGIAYALVYAIMVTATMNISGGHLNPAVTFGVWVSRRISARDAGLYLVAQLGGAVLAGLMMKLIFPANVARVVLYGTPVIANHVTMGTAITLEAVMTFLLVSAVFGTVVSSDAPKVGGFAVGLVVLFAVVVGGPFTGAALNPARAFGPAVVSSAWVGQIAYWVGPLLGALAAGLLWSAVLLPKRPEA